MENRAHFKSITLSMALFAGLVILGYFIFKGLKTFSDKDRVVTVKGLAEMNMTATASAIQLSFAFSGDNLQQIIQDTERKKNAIFAHLTEKGISKDSIKVNNIRVQDRQAYYEYQWINGQQVQVKINRYTIDQSLTVQSDEVSTTEDKAASITLDLARKDLTCNVTTSYTFPELNTIKPQLIAESTKNARISGEQFANDSQAKLGKIKTASQGQITIAGRYYYDEEMGESIDKPREPFVQKARVVSTIVFFLE